MSQEHYYNISKVDDMKVLPLNLENQGILECLKISCSLEIKKLVFN